MAVQVQRSFIRQYSVEDYNKTWFAKPFVFWKKNLQVNHELVKLLSRSIFVCWICKKLIGQTYSTDCLKAQRMMYCKQSFYFCAYVLQVLHEIIKLLTKQKVGVCCYNFLHKINKIIRISKCSQLKTNFEILFHCMQSLMTLSINFTIKSIQ